MDVGIYTESFTNSDLNPLHKGHKEGAKFHKVYILCVALCLLRGLCVSGFYTNE